MLQLHSVSDCRQGAVDFSSGLVTICEGKLHKEFQAVQQQARLPRPFKSQFHYLCPLLDSTTLCFSQLTVEF